MEIKPDGSPVTKTDQLAEEAIREILLREMPDHGILGEEFDPINLNQEHVWVIDPIDGTKQFAADLPNFGILIALCQGSRPVLGMVEQPLPALCDTGCLGYASLARGLVGPCLNGPNLQAYDICALVPVVKGADGVITTWDGTGLAMYSCGAILASANRELQDQALALLDRP